MLKYLNIVTNWTCNSCCTTCFLWKFIEKNPEKLLSLKNYENLFKSKSLKKLASIYFTGGEPTLNKNFVNILKLAKKHLPKTALSYTTNGVSPKLTLKQIDELAKLNIYPHISLSLNGLEKIHDQSRGIKGNFKRLLYLNKELQKRNIKTFFNLTIFPFNIEQIIPSYNLAEKLQTPINLELCRNDKRYNFQGKKYLFTKKAKQKIIASLKKISKNHEMILASYLFVKKYFKEKNFYFDCIALKKTIYIDPYGAVFPCDGFLKSMKVSNIKRKNFDEIIGSRRFKKLKSLIEKKRCQPCKFTCEIKMSMKENRRKKRKKFLIW